jgi:lipoprotein Spr
VDKAALQPGDMMFYYDVDKPDEIGHVGIYLGNGYHIHASSANGYVVICRIVDWYEEALSHGRRAFR